VDGANLGVSWTSGPIVRNRNNILKKGYIETDTPAKLQFRPTWNWVHKHGADIRKLSELCYSPITIYGEWMYATHSIYYDRFPALFLAYDIYVVEDRKFLAPDVFEELMSQTDISYIKSVKHTLNSMQDVVELSESKSLYRNGLSEGIVIKLAEGRWQTDSFKVVNRFFERRDNFNSELLKNKIKM
jgi:hypothetical protein